MLGYNTLPHEQLLLARLEASAIGMLGGSQYRGDGGGAGDRARAGSRAEHGLARAALQHPAWRAGEQTLQSTRFAGAQRHVLAAAAKDVDLEGPRPVACPAAVARLGELRARSIRARLPSMRSRYLVSPRGHSLESRLWPTVRLFGGLLGIPALCGGLVALAVAIDVPALAALAGFAGFVSMLASTVLQWVYIFGATSRLKRAEERVRQGQIAEGVGLAQWALARHLP